MNQIVQNPVVTSVELFRVHMPFTDLAAEAMASSDNGLGMAIPASEPWTHGDFLFVRLEDEDGNEGWGEVFVWMPESGTSAEQMVHAIEAHLARYVLGQDPADVRAIRAAMDRNVARNGPPKAGLDLACFDLAARQMGRPVHDLLGGRHPDPIPMACLVPLVATDVMVWIVRNAVDSGYRTVRLKLGKGPDADREIVAAVRAEVGNDIRIRVDYNQAYRPAEAIRAIKAIEPFGIDAAEQPLPMGDVLGMVEVQQAVDVPLFLHEGFFEACDVVSLVELGGSRVLGINIERPGGILPALDLIDWGAQRGMGTILHNQSLGVSTAAHLHLATSRLDRLGHAVELAGDVMFSHPLVTDPIRIEDGHCVVPPGPGWGVTVDRHALDDHLAGPVCHIDVGQFERHRVGQDRGDR